MDFLGELIADIDDFRVRFKYASHYVDVAVFEIVATDTDGSNPMFQLKDYVSSDDLVGNIDEAHVYLHGTIKWDGCSDLQIGYHHWCGPSDYLKHFAILEAIYKKAQELMPAGGYESPWPAKERA